MITYKVKLVGRKRSETVLADYFRIEGGVLTFREVNPQQGYPIFVKCFAAGAWTIVENVDARRCRERREAQ